MLESQAMAEASLAAFARAWLAEAGCERWWFGELLRRSAWGSDCGLTGSQFGALFAFRAGAASAVQVTIQPAASDEEVAAALGRCPHHGDEAAELLARVRYDVERAGINIQIAIGASPNKPDAFRLYLGSHEESDGPALAETLHRVGFYKSYAEHAPLTEALCEAGPLIGVAKRFGPRPEWAVYHVVHESRLDSSINRIGRLISTEAIDDLHTFAAGLRFNCSPVRWGWTAVAGAGGELCYVKLEASPEDPPDPGSAFAEVPDIFTAYASIQRLAHDHNLELRAQTFSQAIGARHRHTSVYCGLQRRTSGGGSQRQVSATARLDLDGALARGLAAVLAMQDADGAWLDFAINGIGTSDQWVTAFIGWKLAGLVTARTPATGAAARRAHHHVQGCWNGGLAYNRASPIDADSTAHALLLSATLDQRTENVAIDALLRFQRADGGFSTFIETVEAQGSSWASSHAEVTAVAVQALCKAGDDRRTGQAIKRAFEWAERTAGWKMCTRSFWWELDWYARLQWVKAALLAGHPLPVQLLPVKANGRFTVTSSLDAAYLLELCLATGRTADAAIVAKALLAEQQDSGLWPTAPVLRVVDDSVEQPWNQRPLLVYADRGYYSTAAILAALDRFAAIGHRL